MIVKDSYFVNDLFIPQVGFGASNVVNNNDKLRNAISKYEPEILAMGLGRKLTKELYTQINSSTGFLNDGADSIWDDLLNGKEYTKNGEDFFWRGLVDKTGTYWESMMAYYIYYHYVRNGATQMTTMGTKKGKSQNTSEADATPKLVTAWRALYTWYMGSNETDKRTYYYKGHYVEDYFTGGGSSDVSLYQFMSDHTDNYQDWKFTPIENKNVFGI